MGVCEEEDESCSQLSSRQISSESVLPPDSGCCSLFPYMTVIAI
jgi:hypothetical protein